MCQSPVKDWMLVSTLPLTWGHVSSMLASTLKVQVSPYAYECSLVHWSCGMVVQEITRLHYLQRSSGLTVHYAIWKQHVAGYQRPWQLHRSTSFSNITALRGEKSLLSEQFWMTDLTQSLQGRFANQTVPVNSLWVILWTKYISLKPSSPLFLITFPLT